MRAVSKFGLLVAAFIALAARPGFSQSFTSSFVDTVYHNNTDTASAVFSYLNGGSTLQIVLTNTSTYSDYGNNDLITGLFFGLAGNPTLTPVSATAALIGNPTQCATSFVTTCQGTNVNVGHEFKYKQSSTGFTAATLAAPGQYGISSSGYSTVTPNFGTGAVFGTNPPDLCGSGCNSLAFGVVGSSYSTAASSNGLSHTPFTEIVTFTFNITGALSPVVSNVIVSYGTNPDSSTAAKKAPEPASFAILIAGACALGGVRRWRGQGSRQEGGFRHTAA